MPRKGPAIKREPKPDPVYHNPLATQFINRLMLRGKRSLAEKIVYGALKIISEKTGGDPTQTLRKATDSVRPLIEVKSRRVGGATYQVPMEVPSRRSTTLAIRWIVNFSRARRERTMEARLAGELMDAANGVGASVKRREDLHKMAEAYKAFAHYRWSRAGPACRSWGKLEHPIPNVVAYRGQLWAKAGGWFRRRRFALQRSRPAGR